MDLYRSQSAGRKVFALRRELPCAMLLLACCAMLAVPQAHARDRAGDIAIGVAVGTVLGIVAAKASDNGDQAVSAAPVYVTPPVVTVPVYYQPAPVYYPPPVYYYYPSAPMPYYPRYYHHYRR
ncbi:hypothetical protein [Herbaspirillum sp.]